LYCRTMPDLAIRALETERYDARYEWELFVTDSRNWGSTWQLIPEELQTVFEHLHSVHPRVSDVFLIRQGIRMGRKHVFIVPDYHAFPPAERNIWRPVADDDNVFDCRIHDDRRRLLYAYDRDRLLPPREMRSQYPNSLAYLENFRHDLMSRAHMQGKPIWALVRPREHTIMFSPKLVSTQFGRAGSYAFDEKGHHAVTNGNVLVPKRSFLDREAWFFYLALLNSELFMRMLSRKSIKLRGGQYGFDQRYTKDIALPLYESTDRSLRQMLAHIGQLMHTKGLARLDVSRYQQAVLGAYRLERREASLI